jgi:hypothetical protein
MLDWEARRGVHSFAKVSTLCAMEGSVPVGVLSVDCNLHPPGHQADDAATGVEWETLLPASAPVQSQRHRPCDDVGGTDNGGQVVGIAFSPG